MLTPELLAEIKNDNDITWTDGAGDMKLSGIALRGMEYLNAAAGQKLDFSIEGKPKELLFEYVRYVRVKALDEFQDNYLHELLSLQISTELQGVSENADV